MSSIIDTLTDLIPGYGLAKAIAQKTTDTTISPGKALTTGNINNLVTKGQPPPSGQAFALDFISQLLDKAKTAPEELADFVRTLLTTTAGIAAVLSFIPTESNLGGHVAGRIIDRLVGPFSNAAYEEPLFDYVRQFYPTGHVAPRLLVSAIENGGITEKDLVEELVRGGTRNDAIQIITRYARVKRFEAETKDDVALVKSYYTKYLDAIISELEDTERSTIAALKAERKQLTGTSAPSIPATV